MRGTQPLREEHAHLLPRIEDLRRLGDDEAAALFRAMHGPSTARAS